MEINHTQQNIQSQDTKCCGGVSTCLEERNYSDEEINNITELGDILQSIRKRLISEGLSIEKLRENIK